MQLLVETKLFEFIQKDKNLPHSVKTIISNLHTPFLKLAFIDVGFFEKPEHPARVLLDNLAEAGSQWISNDGQDQYGVYEEIKSIVFKIMEEFNSDVSFFSDILRNFERFRLNVQNKHEIKERNTVDSAQGKEYLRMAKLRAKKEIESRVKDKKLPVPVIQLFKVWHNYLTFIILRDSDNKKLWEKSLHIVDELTYYFDRNNNDINRSGLNFWFKDTMPFIQDSIVSLGYDKIKSKIIIENLEKLAASIAKSAHESTDNNYKVNHEKFMPFNDVYPIKLDEDIFENKKETLLEYLNLVEIGSWFKFNNKVRMKIKSFCPKIMKYMLVNVSGNKVCAMSRLDLARKIQSNQAKKLSMPNKTLFYRALEGVRRHLEQEVSFSQ